MQEIILYSTGCPRCKILSKKLLEKGIDFKVCDDVDKMLSMGFVDVPVLSVDGDMMKYTQAISWVQNH